MILMHKLINLIHHITFIQVLEYNHHVIDYVHSHITQVNMGIFRTVRVIQALAVGVLIHPHPFPAVELFDLINHKTHIVVRCRHRRAQNVMYRHDCPRKNKDLSH